MEKEPKVIIALDFASEKESMEFLSKLEGRKLFVKIGMELFYKEGPQMVKKIKELGHRIFLDLKLHDIPNTVEKAMESIGSLGVDMTNVHASGAIKMMEGGKKGLERGAEKVNSTQLENSKSEESKSKASAPMLIAVTQLTSTSKDVMNDEIMIDGNVEDVVIKYAQNTQKAGLNGVVCSPLEVPGIKKACGSEFITVTPGIRFENGEKGDQVRITTPKMAKELGSDYIVVGRPITKAENPLEAYDRCVREFQ